MSLSQIATPIYVAPLCLICDLHLKPYIEKVSIPPEYDQENCYRVRWLCEYCAFKYEREM